MSYKETELVFLIPCRLAIVPLKPEILTYGVLRNFIDIMPLENLYVLRKQNHAARHLSKFRGKIVKVLKVQTDTFNERQWYDYTPYSKVINYPFNTTPLERLEVHVGPDVIPEDLLSKMEVKCYRELHLKGEYDWKLILTFLHPGIKVNLFGNLDLPAKCMTEFFKTLIGHKVKELNFCNDNGKPAWMITAHDTWNNLLGVTFKKVTFSDEMGSQLTAVTNDGTVMEIFGSIFPDETEMDEFLF